MSHPYTEAHAKAVRRAQAAAGLGIAPSRPMPADPKHDDLMNAVMLRLTGYGCEAFPVYNGPTPTKGFVGKAGVVDIGGWVSQDCTECGPVARAIAIEIKMRRDTLSKEQRAYLARINATGGIGLVVRDKLADLEKQWRERTGTPHKAARKGEQ